MKMLQISVLTFHFQFFLFFLFYLFFKDRFDSNCNNLGTNLIENFRNLGANLIHFIVGSEYKEVWHERTSYFN